MGFLAFFYILRMIDEAIDFDFIYDLLEDKYCLDNGRPSIDPVVLIKLPIIQYLCSYSTTSREGYREYKSDPHICRDCPYL